MSMTDPVADLLTRIRNGQKAGKVRVTMPSSGIKKAVLKVLQDEGYIVDFAAEKDGQKEQLSVELKYFAGLTMPEASQVMGISTATAERYWKFARAWLFSQLRGSE